MKIQLSGIVNDSIVDGLGIRMAIFTQGCLHHCPGCHNPQTHPLDGGTEWDTEKLKEKMQENPLLDGITLTGGDPFVQPGPCAQVAKDAHALGLNVWTYTGYTYEELRMTDDPDVKALLDETDVLIDGRFYQSLRSLELQFRGSKNQRVIDMNETRKTGTVTLLLQ